MKEYNEFIKDFNCDGILRDFLITIKDNGNVLGEFFRNEIAIECLSPGEYIGVRYNDNENENDFEIRFIKKSSFSNDGREVLVELFSQNEIEKIYKNYLKISK